MPARVEKSEIHQNIKKEAKKKSREIEVITLWILCEQVVSAVWLLSVCVNNERVIG